MTQDRPRGSERLDKERFEQIYSQTYRSTLAYALRRTDTESDAHDVVADTYLTAWRRLDDLLSANEPQAWLFSIAYGAIRNLRRSKSRRERLVAKATSAAAGAVGADPAWLAEKRDDFEQVLRAMARLSPRDQEILRLVAYENLDYAAIAIVLGIRRPLIRSRLLRARRRLENELAAPALPPETEPGHISGSGSSQQGFSENETSDE